MLAHPLSEIYRNSEFHSIKVNIDLLRSKFKNIDNIVSINQYILDLIKFSHFDAKLPIIKNVDIINCR